MIETKATVFVGLSGGVDSSVAALRLKNQGYNVVGVFIKVWHPDWLVCNWEAERLDAMRVAARLSIPFLTCDAETAYKRDVADYFIAEYEAGRTPNPDVMCNKYVKFGRFFEFAKAHGADYIATGHYAQIQQTKNDYQLLRGVDSNKDQSYFLWTLTQAELAHTLLPVGGSPKVQIRSEAARAGLLTANKPDSQGICFLGHIDIPEFLSHYTELTPGVVIDQTGATIGTHVGALVYTVGQRHGFTVSTKETHSQPYYVCSRDLATNTITVSHEQPTLKPASVITLTDINIIGESISIGAGLQIQTRYRQAPVTAIITAVTTDSLQLELQNESESISAGQSCVLYDGPVCRGGGIIQ